MLAASALANGVRSSHDPARDPGLVLPPLPDLLEGARPGLTFARIDGEDLVVAGEGDGSWLVQLGALVSYARILVLPAVLPALVAPRVLQSVALAQSAKARADIVSLHDALDEYAIENGGRYPDSLDGLEAAVGRFDPWGAPYLYELVRGRPRVYSLGADGVPGGYGDDADIELPR